MNRGLRPRVWGGRRHKLLAPEMTQKCLVTLYRKVIGLVKHKSEWRSLNPRLPPAPRRAIIAHSHPATQRNRDVSKPHLVAADRPPLRSPLIGNRRGRFPGSIR